MTLGGAWGGLLDAFNGLVLAYFLVLNFVYLTLGLLAFAALKRYTLRMKTIDVEEMLSAAGVPPITVLAPAYNEEAGCVESVKSLLTLRYPDFQIFVINDGSKDRTLAKLVDAFEMTPVTRVPVAQVPCAEVRAVYRSRRHPNLFLLDKVNGGKADALNAGLNYCGTPLFCAIDADSLLERDALMRVVRPFLEDSTTVATGGIIRIANGCSVRSGSVTDVSLPRNLLARFQVLEYLRAFLTGRMGWHALDATLVISGAFGLFRHATVTAAGGFWKDTVGEDMELVVRLHRHCREHGIPYRISFVPDPVAWTECPETLKVLGRQRDRWQRGLAQVIWRHRVMLLNPRYGFIGMAAYPYFFFLEMLGPILELGGYLGFLAALLTGHWSPAYVAAFLALSVAFGMALSIGAVAMEELTFRRYTRKADVFRLFVLAVVESLGYRQVLGWWRVKGVFNQFRNSKAWGAMERKGFQAGVAR